MKTQAPGRFRVRFTTSQRDRFYNLVRGLFFDGLAGGRLALREFP